MINVEIGKRIGALAENEEAVKAFAATKTVKERVAVLKDFGINVTEEELAACEAMLKGNREEELTETELGAVSGGLLISIAAVTLVGGLYATAIGGTYALYKMEQNLKNR